MVIRNVELETVCGVTGKTQTINFYNINGDL